VHISEDQDDDRQNLREVMNFSLVVIDTTCVSVILDDVNNEPRHGIKSLKGIVKLPGSDAFHVAVNASLKTNAEEE